MFKNSKRLYFVVLATLLIALGKVQGSAFVFDEEAAVKSFEKRFGHCEAMPYWGVSVPREHGVINSLTENHRNIIFGGRGVDGYGQYGTGNATHYTVNILNDAKPDLLADMNSITELEHLPSERFDVVIATNIMMDHFEPNFFINARRLLVPNGVLIVNTLENYFPDEFGEMHRENRKEENDACLALFGFTSILDQFDSYKPQLYSIGYEDDYFDEVIASIIYRKI